MRLMWRRRLVRLHMLDSSPSVEGVLVGLVAGHYRLLNVSLLETEGRTHELDGEAWVPKERVLLVQRLG